MRYYLLIILFVIGNPLFAQFYGIKRGDILNINGVKGIAFWVNEDGTHGTIMSVKAFRGAQNLYCTKGSIIKGINMNDTQDGKKNTFAVYDFSKNYNAPMSLFPVFEWCQKLGEGWYIPSVEQLKQFVNYWLGNYIEEENWDDESEVDEQPKEYSHKKEVNRILLDAGGIPFLNGVFTSTKDEKGKVYVFKYDKKKDFWEFVSLNPMKIDKGCVGRAFYDF